MTKDDLLECVELCEEFDDLCRRISDLEAESVVRSGLAKLVSERRLTAMKKRKAYVNECIEKWTAEVEALPALERRLIYLRYFDHLSWKRVADELGYSEDYVRGKMHKKALQDLK